MIRLLVTLTGGLAAAAAVSQASINAGLGPVHVACAGYAAFVLFALVGIGDK